MKNECVQGDINHLRKTCVWSLWKVQLLSRNLTHDYVFNKYSLKFIRANILQTE